METRIDTLIKDLRSVDPVVVESAGNNLYEIGPASILSLINGLYDSVTFYRQNVGAVLARFEEPALQQLLNEITHLDDSSRVEIVNLIEPLGHFGKPAVKPLLEILKNGDKLSKEPSPIQQACAAALARIGEPARKKLIKLLESKKTRNQKAAAFALGEFSGLEVEAALLKGLKNSKNKVRVVIVNSLGEIGDAAAIPALEKLGQKTKNLTIKMAVDFNITRIREDF